MSKAGTHPDEIRAAARVRYETDPLITIRAVGEELAIPTETLYKWKQAEGWQKVRPDIDLPLPKMAVAIVRQDKRERGVAVDSGRARALALQHYADERSKVAQYLAKDALAMNGRINRAVTSGNAHDVLLLKQAADAKAKIHSTLMRLWRLNEGAAPIMTEKQEIDVTPDSGS